MKFLKVFFCVLMLGLPSFVMADDCNGRNGTPRACGVGMGWNEDTEQCETCRDKNKGTNRYVSIDVNFTKKDNTTCTYQICQFVCLENPKSGPAGCASDTGASNGYGWNKETQSCTQCQNRSIPATPLMSFSDESSCLYYVCYGDCPDGQIRENGGECSPCDYSMNLYANVSHNQCVQAGDCGTGNEADENTHQCKPCETGKFWQPNDAEGAKCVDVCDMGYTAKNGICQKCPTGKPYSYNGGSCFSDLNGFALISDNEGKQHIELCTESEGKYSTLNHDACKSMTAEPCPKESYLKRVPRNDIADNPVLLQCESCPSDKPYSFYGGNMDVTSGESQCYDSIKGLALVSGNVVRCADTVGSDGTPYNAAADNLSCVDKCPAGSFKKPRTKFDWHQCSYCAIGTASSEPGSYGSCPGCVDGRAANLERTQCVDECGPGEYKKAYGGSNNPRRQCTKCEDGGIYVAGKRSAGCFDTCPDGTELKSDGQCHECERGLVWYDGRCVFEDEVSGLFGMRYYFADPDNIDYLDNSMGIYKSCTNGSFASEDHFSCETDTNLCSGDNKTILYDEKTGLEQCSYISCPEGQYKTYSGTAKISLGCTTCTQKGDAKTGDSCYRCGRGLYFDEDNNQCAKCPSDKPFSDEFESSITSCHSFNFYRDGIGYAYTQNDDGSLNKIACSAEYGMYAPQGATRGLVHKCINVNQNNSDDPDANCDDGDGFRFRDVYNGRGQCVDCDQHQEGYVACGNLRNYSSGSWDYGNEARSCKRPKTAGYYAFGVTCIRHDTPPNGVVISGDAKVLVDSSDELTYISKPGNLYNHGLNKHAAGANLDNALTLEDCGEKGYIQIPLRYPYTRDANNKIVYADLKVNKCVKTNSISCESGYKLITKNFSARPEYFKYFPNHISGRVDNQSMEERGRQGIEIYVDMCVPDLSTSETCTMDPDDSFSRIKYAIPDSYESFASYFNNGEGEKYQLCISSANKFSKLVSEQEAKKSIDSYIYHKLRDKKTLGNIDIIETAAGSPVSPYFNFSYDGINTDNECLKSFCNFYTGAGEDGPGIDPLLGNDGYVTKFYNEQLDLWYYYLDAVIYKLISDTDLVANDKTLGTDTIETYSRNSASNPKNAIDYYIGFWYAGSNGERDEQKTGLTYLLEYKLNTNYVFDYYTQTFKKRSGSGARKELDYNMMKSVYCSKDSLLFNRDICTFVSSYKNVVLEGTPKFTCVDGTTNKKLSGTDQENHNYCKALLLNVEHKQQHGNDTDYVHNFEGICYNVCPAGTEQNEDGVCVKCEAGQYSKNGGVCIDCPFGYYSAEAGSSKCIECPSGHAVNKATKATTCTVCGPGNSYDPETKICTKCQIGTYSVSDEATGSVVCKRCTLGKTTATDGATSEDQCTVDAEYTFKIANQNYSFKFPDFMKITAKKK